MGSRFRLWRTDYYVKVGWKDRELPLEEDRSYMASIDGSGRNAVETAGKKWLETDAGGTSRATIWAFCDALRSAGDPFSGGAPQIVGIWRRGPAQRFGVIWNQKRYVGGLEVPAGSACQKIAWFNELFERCDGETGERLQNAQRHLKPRMRDDTPQKT
jgi:hypothetical protein